MREGEGERDEMSEETTCKQCTQAADLSLKRRGRDGAADGKERARMAGEHGRVSERERGRERGSKRAACVAAVARIKIRGPGVWSEKISLACSLTERK